MSYPIAGYCFETIGIHSFNFLILLSGGGWVLQNYAGPERASSFFSSQTL